MITKIESLFDGKVTVVRVVLAYFLAKLSIGFLFDFFDGLAGAALASELVLFIVFYLTITVLIFPSKLPLKSIIGNDSYTRKAKLNLTSFLLAMILGVIFRYGVMVLNIFYSSMFSAETAQESIDALHLVAANRIAENIDFISLFTKTTISPMIEEFVYRGCILGCLLSRFNVSRSILLSAIIFGVFHGSGFFSAFFGGVFLAAIYVIYKNIFLCFAVHGVVNLFVFLSPSLIVKITPFYFKDLQQFPLFGFSLLPAFMVILSTVLLLTYFWNRRESSPFPIEMTKNHQK